jgi:hypothetical protein
MNIFYRSKYEFYFVDMNQHSSDLNLWNAINLECFLSILFAMRKEKHKKVSMIGSFKDRIELK